MPPAAGLPREPRPRDAGNCSLAAWRDGGGTIETELMATAHTLIVDHLAEADEAEH